MSSFIGFEKLDEIKYKTLRGEETRCHFCSNKCIRTFIDINTGKKTQRYIIAPCEKGEFTNREQLKKFLKEQRTLSEKYPNLVNFANRLAFNEPVEVETLREKEFTLPLGFKKKRKPQETIIGIPRVLNIYNLAPFFRAFFKALGFKKVIFSDYTSEELFRRGAKRGSIDPCFPSKVAIAHIYNLLYEKECNFIFFPCIRTLPPKIVNAQGHWACPTVAATPEVVKAAFTKERDEFTLRGKTYLNPVLDFDNIPLLKRELYESLKEHFKISKKTVFKGVDTALEKLNEFFKILQKKGLEILERLKQEKKVGILILSRPYHRDPGLHHGIPDLLNRLGYPILTIESLPTDSNYLRKLFGNNWTTEPLDITPVWEKPYSENSSLKIWGALFASKHPNLAVVDLSSFRCGHDAPIYSTVEKILEESDTPHFTFHELDENKPSGAIKIRVETIDYFLKRYEEEKLKMDKV